MTNPLKSAWEGLFGSRITPEKLIAEYKQKILEADRKIRGLEYDRKKGQQELDLYIQKGSLCAGKGDTSGQMTAAMKIKLTRAKIGQIISQGMMLQKLQYLHEKAIFTLETASTSAIGDLVQSLKAMVDNPEIARMLNNATLDLEKCKAVVDREFDMVLGELEIQGDHDFGGLSEEMELLAEMARASKAGDEQKVLELQSKISGIKTEDLETETDLI